MKVLLSLSAFLVASCITPQGVKLGDIYKINAVRSENPAVTGTIPKDIDASISYGNMNDESGKFPIHMTSYDKKSKTICFLLNTPNQDAPKDLELHAYNTPEEADKEPKTAGELPVKIKTLSTTNKTDTYQTTEMVQFKDSRGMDAGSASRPTTKSYSYKAYVLESCYPGKVLTKDTKILGLEYKGQVEASVLSAYTGEKKTVYGVSAGWKFE